MNRLILVWEIRLFNRYLGYVLGVVLGVGGIVMNKKDKVRICGGGDKIENK